MLTSRLCPGIDIQRLCLAGTGKKGEGKTGK
jgi:hypothetical protein